jgi:hypothetical protein
VRFFDGGPVQIAGTVSEDDEIADFRWCICSATLPDKLGCGVERNRLALVSDCFYALDPFTHESGPPRVPHCAFNHDSDEARASIRKLAALDLASAWPGHAEPVTSDDRAQLEQATEIT